MLHINTHFFLRWIYGTRRSLTKLCVRHYIMKSFFLRCITAKILCWCLVCRFTINPNKNVSVFIVLDTYTFPEWCRNSQGFYQRRTRAGLRGQTLHRGPKCLGCAFKGSEDFIYNFNDIILKIHKRSFWAVIFGVIGSVWFCRSSFIQMPWLDTLMKSWIF